MPHPGAGFPIPPFEWPHVGRQWPPYNVESDQADGLVMWMPWGGGVPGTHSHLDIVNSLAFTETGTPVWMADSERGPSLLFDNAATEYLKSGSAPVTGAPFTIIMQFNSDDVTHGSCPVSLTDASADDQYFFISHNTWGAYAVTYLVKSGATSQTITSGAGLSLNTWHQICAVEAASNDRRLYVDGGNKVTGSTDIAPTGIDCVGIGVAYRNAVSYLASGRVAGVRVYNVAKTDTEVYQMYTNPWDLHQLPRRLWRLGVVAPPVTIVPVAMHHYRSMRL